METIGSVIGIFAFHPLRCALVALVFSVPLLISRYSRRSKTALGMAAVIWWLFALLEAATPPQMNIRIDLVFLGPVILVATLVGAWCLATGFRMRPERREAKSDDPGANGPG